LRNRINDEEQMNVSAGIFAALKETYQIANSYRSGLKPDRF